MWLEPGPEGAISKTLSNGARTLGTQEGDAAIHGLRTNLVVCSCRPSFCSPKAVIGDLMFAANPLTGKVDGHGSSRPSLWSFGLGTISASTFEVLVLSARPRIGRAYSVSSSEIRRCELKAPCLYLLYN